MEVQFLFTDPLQHGRRLQEKDPLRSKGLKIMVMATLGIVS